MKYVIVGTAGHIDHGKSALVEALTGTDPDRLEEEKRRGITIDLGFAHLDLGTDLRIGFIDVPGHERFVKNMLAGAGGVDLVLLAVAADESIKPQTREHLDISKLLGIRKGLVAVTKSDLVEREILDLVKLEVQEFVAGSFLEGAPVLAVSAKTGDGLETLKNELNRLSREVAAKPLNLPFRLPIDRSFVMKGFGAVVTGTLIAGKIRKESEVEILPLGKRVRVRSLEVHNQPAEEALAGQRTAVNLAGIEAKVIPRGMVLAPPGLFESTERLDCALFLLPSARPLKTHSKVHFHCWTAETVAEAILLEGKEMRPGGRAYAQLKLAEPGLFLPGDRFIIRQFSPLSTLGGGIVLDNQPSKHKPSDERVRLSLELLERGDPGARLEILTQRAGEATHSSLVARTGWEAHEVLRIAWSLAEKKRLVLLGQPASLFVHSNHFQAVKQRVIEQLEKFHTAQPLVEGMSKEDLRGRSGPEGCGHSATPSPVLFNSVLQSLTSEGKVEVRGETVRLAGRQVQLSPEELAAKDQISRSFEEAGLTVPSAQEVLHKLPIDRVRSEKILRILLKEKTLVQVGEDLIFHRRALEKLREEVLGRKAQSNRIDVAVFKELTGLSRKYAIPLLEYLDRERVTRREGGVRIIL